ncbi:hypothetical protein M501DRAFT_985176 [Patellaria atrata CBS 101060]|uniref:Uncharacterized protein n=1 Tax=Patellaria atrata CBS 101060 TaxID=1346257 RepID=A0A9P4SIR0_9PEZI|nr:hypothetical protein M501DRAFT_985176 [Patellaria atrata CBS 101060]
MSLALETLGELSYPIHTKRFPSQQITAPEEVFITEIDLLLNHNELLRTIIKKDLSPALNKIWAWIVPSKAYQRLTVQMITPSIYWYNAGFVWFRYCQPSLKHDLDSAKRLARSSYLEPLIAASILSLTPPAKCTKWKTMHFSIYLICPIVSSKSEKLEDMPNSLMGGRMKSSAFSGDGSYVLGVFTGRAGKAITPLEAVNSTEILEYHEALRPKPNMPPQRINTASSSGTEGREYLLRRVQQSFKFRAEAEPEEDPKLQQVRISAYRLERKWPRLKELLEKWFQGVEFEEKLAQLDEIQKLRTEPEPGGQQTGPIAPPTELPEPPEEDDSDDDTVAGAANAAQNST